MHKKSRKVVRRASRLSPKERGVVIRKLRESDRSLDRAAELLDTANANYLRKGMELKHLKGQRLTSTQKLTDKTPQTPRSRALTVQERVRLIQSIEGVEVANPTSTGPGFLVFVWFSEEELNA